MAKKPKNSELIRIERADICISNSIKNLEILSLVSARGYTLEALNKGHEILDMAREKVKARPAALGTQKDSTSSLKKAGKDAMEAYQDLSNTAKAEFKNDPEKLDFLGLSKPMPRNIAELVERGNALFENVGKNETIKSRLAGHGYTGEFLTAERAKIEACAAANAEQQSAEGAKQVATDEAQAAMKALDEWMAEYVSIAKVALKKKKNLMEKIGIRVRTTKTKAQRAAPKKAAATRAAKKASKSK